MPLVRLLHIFARRVREGSVSRRPQSPTDISLLQVAFFQKIIHLSGSQIRALYECRDPDAPRHRHLHKQLLIRHNPFDREEDRQG